MVGIVILISAGSAGVIDILSRIDFVVHNRCATHLEDTREIALEDLDEISCVQVMSVWSRTILMIMQMCQMILPINYKKKFGVLELITISNVFVEFLVGQAHQHSQLSLRIKSHRVIMEKIIIKGETVDKIIFHTVS